MRHFRRKDFIKLGAVAPILPMSLGRSRSVLRRDLLASRNQLESWMYSLSAQGPRYTGNPAHVAYVEWLAHEFASTGLKVQSYKYSFDRWNASSYALDLTTAGLKTPVSVASYYVRSGQTSKSGITAPLVYGGTADAVFLPSDAAGKIVYLDFVMPPIPLQALFQPFGSYPAGTIAPTETNSAFSFIALPGFASELPGLGQLQSAGVAGAIVGWTNVSDAQCHYQYQPFTGARADVPALHVGQSQTSMIRELALLGETTAHLTLDAQIYAGATTETIIATLPGKTDDIIIINTHTDGPNVVEENGGLALLSIAQYFARISQSQREKTLVFVLATGHMDEPDVPTGTWISQRPDIIAKAVACVTIEHLGAQQWLDVNGVYQYTGMPEYAFAQTQNTGIATPFLTACQGSIAEPTICGNPVAFFGLGAPLNSDGIPTNGFIVGPAYLLTGSPKGEIEKVDFNLMYSQISVLTDFIRELDPLSASQIAGTRVPITSA